MCESTMTLSLPKPYFMTQAAVLRPTPGRASSLSKSSGTSPPHPSTMAFVADMMARVFWPWYLDDHMILSISAGSARYMSSAEGYAEKSSEHILRVQASDICWDIMVDTRT